MSEKSLVRQLANASKSAVYIRIECNGKFREHSVHGAELLLTDPTVRATFMAQMESELLAVVKAGVKNGA